MLDRDFAQHIEDLYAQGDKADALAARGAFIRLRDALGAGEVRAAEPDASSSTGWRCNPWVKQGILLGFRFGRFAYLTDCSAIPEPSFALLHDLDVVVLDALRHRQHPTHFTVAEATAAARRIGAPQTYFTHICHDLPHAETSANLPAGMSLAHDGLVLEVDVAAIHRRESR